MSGYTTIGGAQVSGNNAWTGTNSFIDNLFSLLDNADPTKIAQFQCSGIATGTTRTYTLPNASGTVALIDLAQTWTAGQTHNATVLMGDDDQLQFGANSNANSRMMWNTVQTPDTHFFGLGSTSRHVVFADTGDNGFDFAVPAQTNPTVVICSATASVEQRFGLSHDQTQARITDLATTAANQRPIGLHGGAAVASAATITPTGNVFHVTGTTTITSVTAMAAGTRITIIFDGALTFTDGSNLKLAGDMPTGADDTITLVCDGTNWYEVARSNN